MQQFLVIDMPRVEGCFWRLLYTKLNLPSSTLSQNCVVIKCLKDLDLEDTPPMNVDPDSLTKYKRHYKREIRNPTKSRELSRTILFVYYTKKKKEKKKREIDPLATRRLPEQQKP